MTAFPIEFKGCHARTIKQILNKSYDKYLRFKTGFEPGKGFHVKNEKDFQTSREPAKNKQRTIKI